MPGPFVRAALVLSLLALAAPARSAAPPAPLTETERLYQRALAAYTGVTAPLDNARALALFRQAADKGHPLAGGWVGWMTWQGRGTAKDEAEGRRLMRKALSPVAAAARQGDAYSELLYGNYFLVTRRDDETEPSHERETFLWFERAAKQGNVSAEYNLGVLYQYGRGVAKDGKKSLEWYEHAAAKGHAGAMNNLGAAYGKGDIVEKDDKKAAEWYRKAAEKGLPLAMYNLANAYNSGRGVRRDRVEAQKWYRKAADLGHPEAKKKAR